MTVWAAGVRELSFAEQRDEVCRGLTDQILVTDSCVSDSDLSSLKGIAGLRELLIDQSCVTDAGMVHPG